jgi:hypothetical protein
MSFRKVLLATCVVAMQFSFVEGWQMKPQGDTPKTQSIEDRIKDLESSQTTLALALDGLKPLEYPLLEKRSGWKYSSFWRDAQASLTPAVFNGARDLFEKHRARLAITPGAVDDILIQLQVERFSKAVDTLKELSTKVEQSNKWRLNNILYRETGIDQAVDHAHRVHDALTTVGVELCNEELSIFEARLDQLKEHHSDIAKSRQEELASLKRRVADLGDAKSHSSINVDAVINGLSGDIKQMRLKVESNLRTALSKPLREALEEPKYQLNQRRIQIVVKTKKGMDMDLIHKRLKEAQAWFKGARGWFGRKKKSEWLEVKLQENKSEDDIILGIPADVKKEFEQQIKQEGKDLASIESNLKEFDEKLEKFEKGEGPNSSAIFEESEALWQGITEMRSKLGIKEE